MRSTSSMNNIFYYLESFDYKWLLWFWLLKKDNLLATALVSAVWINYLNHYEFLLVLPLSLTIYKLSSLLIISFIICLLS